ncbi:hypothetical protein [Lactiplantibacillus daowaiensis]|uniref:Uncharacterized protein n=1 Tax=Lactiplantibacillus daowaiensis TaxID=2559918 RepID=A0ABW1S2N5_9LACO|nr:hypothetical protein [Lactiplantibacillus daowaiensis]
MDDSEEKVRKWLLSFDGDKEDGRDAPWEYDFKKSLVKEDENKNKSHLWLELAYRYTNELKNEDCDKVVFPIYHVLGWQNDKGDNVRGDTMNSFMTSFTSMISIRGVFGQRNKEIWETRFNGVPDLKKAISAWLKMMILLK